MSRRSPCDANGCPMFSGGRFLEWDLAVTGRCAVEDLDLGRWIEPGDVAEIDHPTLDCFRGLRSQRSIGIERILALKADIYSLHCGRQRCATWFDEDDNVVWLLGCGLHTQGSRHDAYEMFARLADQGRLMPDSDDYERLFSWRAHGLAETVKEDVDRLVAAASGSPGAEVRGTLCGIINVSLVLEREGDLECLFVAVEMEFAARPTKGECQPPQDWLIVILAGFFPEIEFDQLLARSMPLPTRDLAENEILFMDCWGSS